VQLHSDTEENARPKFIAQYAEKIQGVISGFDRLVFWGTLRALRLAQGRKAYLIRKGVWVGDFGQPVELVTERLKASSLAEARKLGRKVVYWPSSQTDQEAGARRIAAEQKIAKGLICVLTCGEPCGSFQVYGNRETRKLDLVARPRKCLFLGQPTDPPAARPSPDSESAA
jgi:hypothetical protein